jgi:hypothetical protein
MTLNKLGLTIEERTVFYINADNKKRAAEIRQFDPIYGYLLLLDPFTNEEIDFGWDQVSKKWKATGKYSSYEALVEIDNQTPIDKQTDSNVPDKAITVSRFPA